MKFRITIGRRIGLGFGILIFFTLLAFVFTQITLDGSKKINDEINNVITPSVQALENLHRKVAISKNLISYWFFNQSSDDIPDKQKLRALIHQEYPDLKKRIEEISKNWLEDEQLRIAGIFRTIESLFEDHKTVMTELKSFESYDDATIMFPIRPLVEDGEIDMKTSMALDQLSKLIDTHNTRASQKSGEMLRSFNTLQTVVKSLGIALVIGGILIALFTVNSIVKPVQELKKILLLMGRGIVPEEKITYRNDEIGEMSIALNQLMDSTKRTTVFANEVGAGNFDWVHQPLSEQDTLGFTLIRMRDDLRENKLFLEQKVAERTAEVVKQKEEIELQKGKLEHLYNEVTDSIKYAKRIQYAILPPDSVVKKLLPDSFVLFRPKDIVSGDFYWMEQKGGKAYFAAVDCTGHGVPGALMSIVGYNQLKYILHSNQDSQPSTILNQLNIGIHESMHQGTDESNQKDAMDIALCAIDYQKLELQYAGAMNPLFIVRNNEILVTVPDKTLIGMYVGKEAKDYTNHNLKIEKGDLIYIFSDGYCDQFGGPKGKKFMVKQFRDLLLSIQHLTMNEQKYRLNAALEQWRGSQEQVDDILVIGVRV